jgi:hypothetical protein
MSTPSTLAIVLSVLGGLLELSGLALVVREIVADRAQARTRFAPRSPREPRERTYPAPMTAASWAPPSQASAMFTPTEHREAAAKEQRQLETSIVNSFVKLKKLTDEELDLAVGRIEREADEREQELRGALVYVLAGSARRRAIGAGLLAGGILCGTAGSVLSSVG